MNEPNNTNPKESADKKMRFSSSRLMWLVIIVLVGGVAYLTWQNQDLRKPEAQNKIAEKANEQLLRDVRNIILLPDPADEEPVIASVINADSLRKENADFYKDAQDGDTLLIYSSKALIYRQSENKIINVAPVALTPGNEEGLSKEPASAEEESK